MARAVALAWQGRGDTAPNPCVGSVLVRDGQIVAEGWHHAFGGPHAERECLADARSKGMDVSCCTLYVTLEPCNHHGKTPPCTDAVLEAGISRVVVGATDPNPVAQGGIEKLRASGVEVIVGVLKAECRDLIRDFRLWQESDRAYCILKMAATLDGRIASRTGDPEAVSCPESFQDVHRLRSQVGAVMVGGNTFLQDNPSLTCRLDTDLAKETRQPYAVVLTSRLPGTACELNLIRNRPHQTVFWTSEENAETGTAQALREIGVRVWGLPWCGKGLDIATGLTRLRQELEVFYTLCEGGGRLATALLEQRMADEFVLYLAPRVLGDEHGVPLFAGRDAPRIRQALDLRLGRSETSGRDLKLTYYPD